MNILFEIADRDLMIIGAILLAIVIAIVIIFKIISNKNKVKPISEEERYDSEIELTEEEKPEVTLTEEQKQAKEELQKVFNQMALDLENQNPTPEEIDAFEREQEENAIISYQELMAEADKLKAKADSYEKKAEAKADMKVQSAIDTYKAKEDSYHKFKTSDIISPIYGIQREKKSKKSETNGIISKAYKEETSENQPNIDFLNSLKEFRKNL